MKPAIDQLRLDDLRRELPLDEPDFFDDDPLPPLLDPRLRPLLWLDAREREPLEEAFESPPPREDDDPLPLRDDPPLLREEDRSA